jgi:hypothetical protein
MIDLYIERWIDPTKGTTYFWSVWIDGRQFQRSGPQQSAEASEHDGLAFCASQLKRRPDDIHRL